MTEPLTHVLNRPVSFPDYYWKLSIFMDFEWLLSTLFDASLLSTSSRRQRRLFFVRGCLVLKQL